METATSAKIQRGGGTRVSSRKVRRAGPIPKSHGSQARANFRSLNRGGGRGLTGTQPGRLPWIGPHPSDFRGTIVSGEEGQRKTACREPECSGPFPREAVGRTATPKFWRGAGGHALRADAAETPGFPGAIPENCRIGPFLDRFAGGLS